MPTRERDRFEDLSWRDAARVLLTIRDMRANAKNRALGLASDLPNEALAILGLQRACNSTSKKFSTFKKPDVPNDQRSVVDKPRFQWWTVTNSDYWKICSWNEKCKENAEARRSHPSGQCLQNPEFIPLPDKGRKEAVAWWSTRFKF